MPRVVTAERPHRIRWIRSRLAYLALIAFMVFFAYTFLQKTKEIRALAQQESALRDVNAQLSADNNAVSRNIGYYQTPAYVEARARSDLGFSKPGEFIIQSNPRWQRIVTVRPAPPRPALQPEPIWKQWLDAFTK